MRKIVASVFLGLAVMLSACDTQTNLTAPGTGPTVQSDQFDALTGPGAGVQGDPGIKGDRQGVDMDALMYLSLIMKANPTIDPAKLDEIRRLITQNYELRLAAIKSTTDKTALQALLQKLHDELMAQINALLSTEELANIEALKAKIEKDKNDSRKKIDASSIDAQVQLMTKVLGLTEAQAAEVKKLLLLQQAEAAALKKQYAGDAAGLKAALAALQQKYDAMLKQLLGDELWNKWLTYRAGGGKTGGGKTGGGDTGGGKTGGGKTGGGDTGGGKTGGGKTGG